MLRRADVSVSILIRKWALGLLTFCRTDAGHRWQRWLPLKSCIVHSLRVSSHVHGRNVRTRVKFVNWDVRYSRCSIGEQQQLLFACESKFVGGFEALIAWAFFICLSYKAGRTFFTSRGPVLTFMFYTDESQLWKGKCLRLSWDSQSCFSFGTKDGSSQACGWFVSVE